MPTIGKDYDEAKTRAEICALMPDALTKASGTRWTVAPGENRDRDHQYDEGDIRAFYGRTFCRAADGFAITISRSGNGRVSASVSWPSDPSDRMHRGSYRDAPGVSYSAEAPGCTSAMSRPVATIAKQALRALDQPEYVAAFHAVTKRWADNAESAAQATEWIAAVSEASGIRVRDNPHNSGVHFLTSGLQGASWVRDIKAQTTYPAGSVLIDLPRDPQGAAAMVRRLKAAVEA
jgi:hypothetical protein